MTNLEPYLKPRTNGANISPFSIKNLPKTKYIIPDEDQKDYKNIVEKLGDKRMFFVSHMSKKFMQSLISKNNTWEDIKSDMALKGLSGNNYIHSIGKWNEYVKFLNNNLEVDICE